MKKTFSILGMISGAIVIVLGVLLLSGVFGGNTSSNYDAGYLYNKGYATFGADFYTYVTNNAAEAASASKRAANNLNQIANVIRSGMGIFLMGFGMLTVCLFAGKIGETRPQTQTVQQEGIGNIIQKSVEQAIEAKKQLLSDPRPEQNDASDELPEL